MSNNDSYNAKHQITILWTNIIGSWIYYPSELVMSSMTHPFQLFPSHTLNPWHDWLFYCLFSQESAITSSPNHKLGLKSQTIHLSVLLNNANHNNIYFCLSCQTSIVTMTTTRTYIVVYFLKLANKRSLFAY